MSTTNTKVANVKVAVLRKEGYTDLEQWMNTPNNVYIGRHGRIFIHEGNNKRAFNYSASPWCNPFKVEGDTTLDMSLNLYRTHLTNLLQDPVKLASFLELKGKNLGCWCKPKPCHGDVIVEFLNNY